MAAVMPLLHAENEENVSVVLRILMELHKNFKQRKPEGGGPPPEGSPQMEQHVVPYLDFVRKVIMLKMLLLYGLSVAWTSSARQSVISACCARWRHDLAPFTAPRTNR